MYKVVKYTSDYFEVWNQFIDKSKNGTFLFHRNFMEYHKDRFEDFSLLVFKEDKLVAVLPANVFGNKVFSHQGLTYGGVIWEFRTKFLDAIDIINSLIKFYNSNDIVRIQVKMLPTYYHKVPSDELNFYIFRVNGSLIGRDVAMVINYDNHLKFKKNRREGINKALRSNIQIREDQNFSAFWEKILIPNLKNKHNTHPVHSLVEIEKLATLFPDKIRQVNAYDEEKNIIAGTTVFLTDNVVHPQYVSGGEFKNSTGAIDLLYDYIIEKFKTNRKYFNFNTSSENNGELLNQGLIFWKESCGARAFTIDTYELATSKIVKLNLK